MILLFVFKAIVFVLFSSVNQRSLNGAKNGKY